MSATRQTLLISMLISSSLSAEQTIHSHRRTLDGRLCAAAFTVDQRDYSGCVTLPSPDGVVGREWCYVAEQVASAGANPWGFCAEAVSFGRARAVAQAALEERVSELSDETAVMLALSAEADRLTMKVHADCAH